MNTSISTQTPKERTPGFFGSERATQITLRIGYIGCSAYLFWIGFTGFASGELTADPRLLIPIFGLYGLSFCLMFLGAASNSIGRLERWQPLIFVSFALAFLFQYFLRIYEFQFTPTTTDAFLFSDYASQLLLLGENPYSWDMGGAFSDYRVSTFFTSPLLNGEIVSGLNYPALHFLTLIPSTALGISESRIVLVIAFIGTMVLFYRNAPAPLKGIVLLPLFVNWDYVNWPLGFVTDVVWVFLLVAMVASWRRANMRAVLFGLAAAYKQIPWLLGPFIVLRIWLDQDDPDQRSPGQRIARFIGISVGTFLTINAPFLLSEPAAWLTGVLTPLADPLIYYGQGLSAVTQFDLLQLPKSFYFFATAIVFAALGALYWLNFRRLKEAMWIFPGLFLWFSYRGLQSYYIYWLLLLLMALLVKYRHSSSLTSDPEENPKLHPYSWIIVGAASLGLVGGLVYSQTSMKPLSLELTDAATGISENQINILTIRVANTSNQDLTPRFAVHSRIHQPYPWLIESGPNSLKPGEEGIYEIGTDLPYRMIDLARGALLVVTDASGDYRLRGTLQIQRDPSLLGPDSIFNSAYLHGPKEDDIPWGWGFDNSAHNPSSIRDFETPEGFRAIEIGLAPTLHSETWEQVGLSQWVPFPNGDLSTWVHPPQRQSAATLDPSSAYGLEFDDGSHKLWVLFGSDAGTGYIAEDHYYINQPAPPDRWSEQHIDLRAIYDQLDWELPPLLRIVRKDLELLTRMVTVRLIVAARDHQETGEVTGMFGPLSINQGRNPVHERVAETVKNQAEYYTVIGDMKLEQRNYADASTDYNAALATDPEQLSATFGLGESLFWQGDYDGAALAYRQVLEDPDLQAQAYKGLAWSKFNLGEFNLARTYFKDSIRLGIDPPFSLADSYNGLGWVYLRLGQCEEAISYFEQALEINPEFQDSLRGIETCRGLMKPD